MHSEKAGVISLRRPPSFFEASLTRKGWSLDRAVREEARDRDLARERRSNPEHVERKRKMKLL